MHHRGIGGVLLVPAEALLTTFPDLAGKVVLVTGAGSGIGLAIARQFAEQGSKIAGVGRSAGPLEAAMTEIRAGGGEAIALRADVSDEEQVRGAVEAALAHFGQIDVLVNNAGFATKMAPVVDTELSEWNELFATVLTGAMLCSKHVGRHLISRKTGVIVNISSVAGKIPRLNAAPYSTAKAALDQLTRVLALELAKDGIRVNAVSPGTTCTDRLKSSLVRTGESLATRIRGELAAFRSPTPLGRAAETSEQASVVLFLASDASSYMTGQVLYVDGGVSII